MAKKKETKDVGRPKRELTEKDLDQITACAKVMCSWDEIGEIIDWPKSTLEKKDKAKAAYHKGVAQAKQSLRKAQFELAVKDKNATMLIWLGKIHLGQREIREIEVNDDGACHVSIGVFQG